MGRCINYQINNEKEFTDEEVGEIYEISQRYSTGALADVWSCETFYIDIMGVRPNLEFFRSLGEINPWEVIESEYNRLRDTGLTHSQARRIQLEKGMVEPGYQPERLDASKQYWGFTKVQGNELNALLILRALIDISLVLPKATIEMIDEGEFLLCAILIKDGKVKIDPDREIDEEHQKEIDERLKDAESIDGWYKDRFILSRARDINPEDFKDLKVGYGTLMAGFYGEYYGINKVDPEKESYKMLDMVTSVLGDNSDMKISILGEKKQDE